MSESLADDKFHIIGSDAVVCTAVEAYEDIAQAWKTVFGAQFFEQYSVVFVQAGFVVEVYPDASAEGEVFIESQFVGGRDSCLNGVVSMW